MHVIEARALHVVQIPDEFTEYFLERSGVDCKDVRM